VRASMRSQVDRVQRCHRRALVFPHRRRQAEAVDRERQGGKVHATKDGAGRIVEIAEYGVDGNAIHRTYGPSATKVLNVDSLRQL
jgi:hypothetical protein